LGVHPIPFSGQTIPPPLESGGKVDFQASALPDPYIAFHIVVIAGKALQIAIEYVPGGGGYNFA
jgi:hypothetical protein